MLHLFQSLLGQVAAPQQAVELAWYQEGWFLLLLALLVVVGPFVVGHWLAKRLRMNDYGWKIGVVLFALIGGLVVCWRGWPPRLGIDLSGGVILVYEVDQSKRDVADVSVVVERVRKALADAGETDFSVVGDPDGRLIVTLPGADPSAANRVESQIGKVDLADVESELVIQSRPVRDGKQTLVFDVRRTTSIDMDKMVAAISRRVNPGGQKEVTIRRMGQDRVEVIIPQVDAAEIDIIKEKISTAGALKFRILANPTRYASEIALGQQTEGRDVKVGEKVKAQWVLLDPEKFQTPQDYQGFTVRTNRKGELEVLVVNDPWDVGGAYLSRAYPGMNDLGQPAVHFSFNSAGAVRFGELTGSHLPDENSRLKYQLGIVLDGVLKSAPNINSTITSSGIIEGQFTEQEVQNLVDILNAGSLPAALSKIPVAEYAASAQLGQDTIRAGARAMLIGTLVVIVFMQLYYRFAGLVANLAVVLNVILVLAILILIKAHLTLAGLAGLVLSVGMAVDANVLIYERMREELERGAALRMAIRNGFSRAMSTIVDSNLTTLIVGIVLYVMGTDQLRGFATTLILGLTLNLFTAVYCARIIFDIAEKQRWITKLKMMKLFGKTNFDFVGWARPAIAASVIVILVGLAGAITRGAGLFGIDFTGGSAVQLVFAEPINIAEVRKTLAALPDASVSAVGSAEHAERDTRFNINTSDPDIQAVEEKLQELFPGKLKMYSMEIVSVGAPAAESSTTDASESGAGEQAANSATGSGDSGGAVTEAKLRFPDGINQASLEATLEKARLGAKLPEAVFDLSSPEPEFTPGGSRPLVEWTVKTSLSKEQTDTLLAGAQQSLAASPIFPAANNIGGKVAGDTKVMALYALTVSNLLIVLYVWVRFQNLVFGVAAVAALVHDVLVTVAALALSQWLAGPLGFLMVDQFKISLEVVAALLTIVGFSINDTIVIFDRIREIRGKSPEITAPVINLALNQTLSRTVLTAGTVFLVTLILYWFGGESIHGFAFAMLIGVISGSYSSLFIAAPIVLWLRKPASAGATRPFVRTPVPASGTAS